jgi:hypothetical protein
MNRILATLIVASVGGMGAVANAEQVNVTITTDNHYALFSSSGSTFSYHGGNETGAGGAPGLYNWSEAESYAFESGNVLYIAAWSDDSVAQGVLAEFHSDSMGELLSGDPRWEVYGTGINRGDGDAHPDALEVGGHVLFADTNGLWETPFVGDANGVAPWGTIAGITGDARWMWRNAPGDADPLHGGSGEGEMLIFRTPVPAPGAAAVVGLASLGMLRRRR